MLCPKHLLGLLLCAMILSAAPALAYTTGDQVDTFDVGDMVDHLQLGFRHWSSASGDPTPDIDSDGLNDINDSFGDHSGAFTTTPYSVWDAASEDYGISHWPFTLDPNNVMSFTMTVPAGGQYILAFQGLFHTTGSYTVEYQKGATWVPISDFGPKVGDAYQTLIYCYVIEADPGQTQIPIRIYSAGYKLGIGGFVLATPVEDPFAASDANDPNIPHGNAIFDANEAAEIWARTTGNTFLYNRYLDIKSSYNASSNLSSGYFNNLSTGIVDTYWGRLLCNTLFSELDGDTTRRDQAIQILEKCTGWADFRTLGKLHQGSLLRVIAIAYDHLYDDLTPAQRDSIRRKLDRGARNMYVDYMTMNQFSLGPRAGNWCAVTHSGLAAAGMVLRNESRYASQYLNRGRWGCQFYIETAMTESGACRESYGYYVYGMGTLAPAIVMFQNILGENLYDYDSGVLHDTVPYSHYMLEPTLDGFFNFDDMDYGYSHNADVPMMFFAGWLKDPLAHALVKRYSGEDSGRSGWPGWRRGFRVYSQLWYDPGMTTTDPDAVLPLAATFNLDDVGATGLWDTGHVVMRTGFTSTDDIAFALQCGDSAGFHGHPDQGSFLLTAYGGQLVSQVGKFGSYSSAGNEWAHGQTSSSVVLIDGYGQVDDHRWGNGRMERDGTIDDFYHDANIGDYSLANSKLAYEDGSRPVDHALRHVMFIRKPGRRGYFVIADDVQSAAPGSHDYSWLLHGSEWHSAVLGGAGSFRFEESSSSYSGQASKFEGKDADLQVMFATPASPTMQIVTGESTVKGWANFPPYVKSTTTADRGVFVAMLYPESDRLGIYTPTVTRIDDGNLAGFELNDDLVLFSKSAGLWTYDDVQSDATMVYLDRSVGGEVSYLVAGATTLSVQGVEVFSSALATTASGTYVGLPFDGDPPTITAWYSAGDHGRGVGEALLEIADDGSFSESRSGGVKTLLVAFNEPLDQLTVASATIDLAGRDANNERMDMNGISVAVAARDATTAEIIFTPALADYARYYVNISGVTDLFSNAMTGDNDRIVAALAGDASGDLRVNSSDMSVIRGSRTKLIDPNSIAEVRSDLTGDGRVNVADLSRMRPRMGNDATGIVDPEPDPNFYQLTVNVGSGDGSVAVGDVVNISADTAPAGKLFDVWMGDAAYLADANDPNTTVTMPESAVTVTATYRNNIPDPWRNGDFGSPGIAGTTYYIPVTDLWAIETSGAGITGSSDEFHYAYRPCSGDAEIVVNLTAIYNSYATAKYGVMIRESLDQNSKNAFLSLSVSQAHFQWRSSTGGGTSVTTDAPITAPRWLKLKRVGNTFYGYRSSNGTSWTLIDSVTVSMNADVYIGLAGASFTNDRLGLVTYENVSVSP